MRRAARLFLALSSLLMLIAFVVGGRSAAWAFALLAVLFPVALVLSALRDASRTLRAALALLAMVLVAATVGLMTTGLPASARWMLGGLGLAPLILVVGAYTATFRAR